jgi:hypothetical protein
MWPEVARCLPTLAPRKLVSSANVRPGRTGCRPAAAPETGSDDLPRPSPRSTRPSSGPPTRTARRTRCHAADRGRAYRPPGRSARTRSPALPRYQDQHTARKVAAHTRSGFCGALPPWWSQLPAAQYRCILAMASSLLIAATSASLRRTRVRSKWTRSAGSASGGASGEPRSGFFPSWTHAQNVA